MTEFLSVAVLAITSFVTTPMNEIEKSILKVILYFDIFSKVLTKKEIWDNLQTAEADKRGYQRGLTQIYNDFKKSLTDIILKKFIEKKNDFYFLKGRESLIKKREKRESISQKNWLKLKKISRTINHTPFLKGVFVSGSLAINNSDEDSDIDLLVITKKGRIFTVRFFLTLILDLIGERRKPGRVAGKICLNQFQTENSLKVIFPTLYNAYTYLHLKPIIDREGVFTKFRDENDWLGKYLLFLGKKFPAPFRIGKKSKIAEIIEKILKGKFGDLIERKLKGIQIRRKKKCKKGRIILEDGFIELHPDSAEEEILANYEKRLKEMSLS